jgi:hypothetical protein
MDLKLKLIDIITPKIKATIEPMVNTQAMIFLALVKHHTDTKNKGNHHHSTPVVIE